MGKKFPSLATLALLILTLAACAQSGSGAGSEAISSAQSTQAATSADAKTPAPNASLNAPTPSSSTTAAPGNTASDVELSIAVKESVAAIPVKYVLICRNGADLPGSTLPTAEAACKRLIKSLDIIQPLQVTNPLNGTDNATQQCTQEYGGPQEVSVTGTVAGEPISRSFNLKDGCQISAWNAAKDILGSTAGAQ